ncbi:MAG TPA: choice-of-anchor tandem repeat GloVer-containing protein [Bryobacteraceae bacterium]|nr:choice-of-anchor tandem repeat GloVer-containing protein [Bryobacteraceae bacterium]
MLDAAGNVFGVSTAGGANGAGVVFGLTPTKSGEWTETILYTFKGEPSSGFPYGALVADAAGNLYGTAYYAVQYGMGAVYRLSLRNGAWVETWLYSLMSGAGGNSPISTLAADASGNLYGTTSAGGSPKCGCGVIFKLTLSPDAAPVYSVAHRFQGPPDGAFVYNGMVANAAGTVLYGATVHGGTANEGAIYQFLP